MKVLNVSAKVTEIFQYNEYGHGACEQNLTDATELVNKGVVTLLLRTQERISRRHRVAVNLIVDYALLWIA